MGRPDPHQGISQYHNYIYPLTRKTKILACNIYIRSSRGEHKPVQSARKFSAVRGTTSAKSCNLQKSEIQSLSKL